MTLARRTMLQALGGLPLAGPSVAGGAAKSMLSEMLISLKVEHDSSVVGNSKIPSPIRPHGLAEAAWQRLYQMGKAIEDEQRSASTMRVGGIDPDLAAMRSLSPTYRALKQRQRNEEFADLYRRFERATNW